MIYAYNTIVVGATEAEGRQVNVRNRDDETSKDRGQPVDLQVAVEKLVSLLKERRSDNPFPGEAKPAAAPAEKASA